MGNSLCCTQNGSLEDVNNDVIPIEIQKKRYQTAQSSGKLHHQSSGSLLIGQTSNTNYRSQKTLPRLSIGQSPNQKGDVPTVEFEIKYAFPIRHLSFSQRRVQGFRNKYEFDKRRLILGSDREFAVVGYDYERRVFELFRSVVSFEEEIKFISFLEDNTPSFIFMITFNTREQKTYFKILKLNKNKKFCQQIDFNIEETKASMHQ